jgi:hypothetical protein
VRVVRAQARRFDLSVPADRTAYLAFPRALEKTPPREVGFSSVHLPAAVSEDGFHVARLELRPDDLFISYGSEPLSRSGRETDLSPVSERRIRWSGNNARVGDAEYFVPGSAIKGALRHRVAFHLARLCKHFASVDTEAAPLVPEHLMGAAKENDEGAPGRVAVADAWLERAKPVFLQHVTIDRFSGGPMDGHLFDEAPLSVPSMNVELVVDLRRLPEDEEARKALRRELEALRLSLHDLLEGRLALGAASSRGHGYFTGSIDWRRSPPWEVVR